MKKNLFFLALFFLIGCGSSTTLNTKITCPDVLFSTEHKNYISSTDLAITLENISYTAQINNYSFNEGCSKSENEFTTKLSLLFVVQPNQAENNYIILPFYVAILNQKNELLDIQYYIAEGIFEKDLLSEDFIETELSKTIGLNISQGDKAINENFIIVIGFMLDKKKLKIIN